MITSKKVANCLKNKQYSLDVIVQNIISNNILYQEFVLLSLIDITMLKFKMDLTLVNFCRKKGDVNGLEML